MQEQRLRQSSGVMHPEEKKNESEKETNASFIFMTTHCFPNRGVISVFINEKRRKSNSRNTIEFNLTKAEKEMKSFLILFLPERRRKKEENKKQKPHSQV